MATLALVIALGWDVVTSRMGAYDGHASDGRNPFCDLAVIGEVDAIN